MGGSRSRPTLSLAALLLSGAALVVPIGRAGIWEPRELESAELARRIAVRLLGAGGLAVPGDPAALPSLGDLRSGELPFVAMAGAFRVFGLHPWAGRLALALFALGGLVATWQILMRFAGPRAAGLGAIVLASMPLYAVQARTMLGDAAAMGSFALALAGLAGVVLEPRMKAALSWSGVALVGLIAGFLSRGLLFGVSVPLVAVGLGSLVVMPALGPAQARRRVMFGSSALALGLAALVTFLGEAWSRSTLGDGVVTRVTAMSFEASAAGATFETTVRRLGHALFPWSILAPCAIARLLSAPPAAAVGRPREAEALRILVALGAGTALAASTLVAPMAMEVPFVGVSAVAAAIALALDDLADGATPSLMLAWATLTLAAILGFDLVREPDRVLGAFGSRGGAFPDSLLRAEKLWIAAVAAVVGLATALALSIGSVPPNATPRGARAVIAARLGGARALAAEVSTAWNGNFAFLLVVLEAALVGLAAMVAVGRWLGWSSILRLPELYQHAFLHLFWLAPLAVALAVAIPTLGADALRSAARRLGTSPPMIGASIASVGALAFVVGFHPTLAAQLSPREALEAFATLHRPGEPLGLLGMSPRLVAYHGGGEVRAFARPDAAFAWFAPGETSPAEPAGTSRGEPIARRWLVVPHRELAKLNALHRERFGKNLPIADASSSQTLLAVSDLAGLPQRSPLRDVVLDAPPTPEHEVRARFGEELELLGWDVRDDDGEALAAVPTRTRVEARIYLRVTGAVDSSFKPFLHVDRGKLRFNGDEAFVDRGYPPASWIVGDVVVLTCEVLLEANFPIGEADVYFGFFAGTARMKVTEGAASVDRAKLGKLLVR